MAARNPYLFTCISHERSCDYWSYLIGNTCLTTHPPWRLYDIQQADVERAVAAARAAFDYDSPWRKMTPSDRSKVLHKFADLIERDIDYIAVCILFLRLVYSCLAWLWLKTIRCFIRYFIIKTSRYFIIRAFGCIYNSIGYWIEKNLTWPTRNASTNIKQIGAYSAPWDA